MYKKLCSFFLCLILLCLSGCFNYNDSPSIISGNDPNAYKDTLAAVLNNKKAFITQSGEVSYLKNYKIQKLLDEEQLPVNPCEYTYVDFDGDTMDELIINISAEYGYYLILHYNGYDIFSYEADMRTMATIKADGSFSGSSGASNTLYCKATFKNNKLSIKQKAFYDSNTDTYQIDGNAVSADDFQAFLTDWNQTQDVTWTRIGASNAETTPISTTESTVETPPEYFDSTEDGTSQPTIDLNKYAVVTYSGYSGAGNASVSMDKERFLKDNSKIAFKSEDAQAEYAANIGSVTSPTEALFELINKVSLSASELLSNNDQITLKWNISKNKIEKYFNTRVSWNSATYIVSGLDIPGEFNPMEYISVSYIGTAPCGELCITTDTSSVTDIALADIMEQVCHEKNFTCTDTVYKPGETVEITYSPVDLSDARSRAKFIDTYGLLPTVTKKSFTLTGFSYHPTQLSQMNLDILNEADSLCRRKLGSDDYLKSVNITRNRVYYVTPSSSEYDADNLVWSLYVVYKVDAVAEFWNLSNAPAITKDITYYYVIEYPSIKINADGVQESAGYSTLINPIGNNGGVSFHYWESDGKLFDTEPASVTGEIIEHHCYQSGFSTLDKVENALRNKGSLVEVRNY